MPRAPKRCFWAGDDPLMVAYHDQEWGVPIHDDRRWYEKLTLDGAQAGLSWMTILRKREGYRDAFRAFDAAAVARFSERDVVRLMKHSGIVRNRLKIRSAIGNARALLAVAAEHGSFDAWIWAFIGGRWGDDVIPRIYRDALRSGDLDVALVSLCNDWSDPTRPSLVWLENDGHQNFTMRPIDTTPIGLITVACGDLNHDGRADIVAGSLVLPPITERRVERITAWVSRKGQ